MQYFPPGFFLMKRNWIYKVIFVLLVIMSCIMLTISLPFLIKILLMDDGQDVGELYEFSLKIRDIYFGGIAGIFIVVYSIFRLEGEKQAKLARFLLIISTISFAFYYIIVRSN